jgi:hypothetical protein
MNKNNGAVQRTALGESFRKNIKSFARSVLSLLGARRMVKVWKIAPGYLAEDWELSREHGCIALGWTRLPNFAKFRSHEDILRALIKAHPAGDEEGNREGAARSIWYFVRKVEPGHIVVANNGRGKVVGIGRITGDYLSPKSSENPIRNDERIWRRHARRVEWMIVQSVDLQEPFFFGINTVTSLAAKRVALIRQAYARKNPALKKKLTELFG